MKKKYFTSNPSLLVLACLTAISLPITAQANDCPFPCYNHYGRWVTVSALGIGAIGGAAAGLASSDSRHGSSGHDGKNGKTGAAGANGKTGLPGTNGLPGPTGPVGETGLTGDQGPEGQFPTIEAFPHLLVQFNNQSIVAQPPSAPDLLVPELVILVTVYSPDGKQIHSGVMSRDTVPPSFIIGGFPNDVVGPNGSEGQYSIEFFVVDGPPPGTDITLSGIGEIFLPTSITSPIKFWHVGESYTAIINYHP